MTTGLASGSVTLQTSVPNNVGITYNSAILSTGVLTSASASCSAGTTNLTVGANKVWYIFAVSMYANPATGGGSETYVHMNGGAIGTSLLRLYTPQVAAVTTPYSIGLTAPPGYYFTLTAGQTIGVTSTYIGGFNIWYIEKSV